MRSIRDGAGTGAQPAPTVPVAPPRESCRRSMRLSERVPGNSGGWYRSRQAKVARRELYL